MVASMNFIITLYRRNSHTIQHFNAATLPEARSKMLQAQADRFAIKVEMSVILDTWNRPVEENGK